MEIKRYCYHSKKYNNEHLRVTGVLHFDNKYAFCGQPWIHLIAYKNAYDTMWKDCQICIAIHDQDDFDIGFVYSAEDDGQFFEVLHELINWMNDLEHGVCSWDKFIDDIEGFFPNCGCKQERW